MKTCIYCRTTDQSAFKGVEHLIPQSFGTFGTATPTLDCVCDGCNNLFGRTIDQDFARDSWEGVTRYKQGIQSSEKRSQTRLKFKIDEEEGMGGFVGAQLDGVDSQTGKVLLPVPQFQILNIQSNEFEVYRLEQIKDLELPEETYGIAGSRKTKVFAPSEAEYDQLIEELKKIGIDNSKAEKFRAPFIEGKKDGDEVSVPILVEGRIDSPIKRAVVKILFNFAAKYIGVDEVLKPEWDKARNYVRLESEPLDGNLSAEPFWGDETATLRFQSDSFNIIVDNEGANVVGKLQAYNFYTYNFVLVENYNMPAHLGKGARFTKGQKPFWAEKRERDA